MRIGIDVRCLGETRRTGVQEYALNLLENLFRADKKNEYILFFNAWRSDADFSWTKKYPNVTVKRFGFPNKLLNFCFWYLDWPKMDKMLGRTDVFFMPNIIFGSVSKDTKLLITIHDLSYEIFPRNFSLKMRLWHLFVNPKKLCGRAAGIVAVSESTKNDLVRIYKIDPKKISVIYSAASEKISSVSRNDEKLVQIKEKYELPYRFILYLGTIEPRKNIIGTIRAYDILQERGAEKGGSKELSAHDLVIAGAKGWLTKGIFSEIERSKFRNKIRFIDFVPESEKKYIYNLASLFVYPSFFEGFGFPVLEAMSCGVPVVASNTSSLPEIIGDAGIMVDPEKPQEIAEALQKIISEKELREKFISKGFERADKFNWRKTTKEFLGFLRKMEKRDK